VLRSEDSASRLYGLSHPSPCLPPPYLRAQLQAMLNGIREPPSVTFEVSSHVHAITIGRTQPAVRFGRPADGLPDARPVVGGHVRLDAGKSTLSRARSCAGAAYWPRTTGSLSTPWWTGTSGGTISGIQTGSRPPCRCPRLAFPRDGLLGYHVRRAGRNRLATSPRGTTECSASSIIVPAIICS
jgi:hypothetical protein